VQVRGGACERSAIVNLDEVRDLKPMFHGDHAVLLRGSTELGLSRSYRGRLRKLLDPSV
jgi:two-component system LytT family response regulator